MKTAESMVEYHKKGSRLITKWGLIASAVVGGALAFSAESTAKPTKPKLPPKIMIQQAKRPILGTNDGTCASAAKGFSVDVRPSENKKNTMNFTVRMPKLPEACDSWGAQRLDVTYMRDKSVDGKRRLVAFDQQTFSSAEEIREVSVDTPKCYPGSLKRRDAIVVEPHYVSARHDQENAVESVLDPEIAFTEGYAQLPKQALGAIATASC